MENKKYKILVISNITLEIFFSEFIETLLGKNIDVKYVSSENLFEKILEIKSYNPNMTVVMINFQRLYPNFSCSQMIDKDFRLYFCEEIVSLCEKWYAEIVRVSTGQVVWFLFEKYYSELMTGVGCVTDECDVIDKINIDLTESFSRDDNVVIVDTHRIIATIGVKHAYNNIYKYRWNLPYSDVMVKQIATEIYKQYKILKGYTPKCIVLDCDNVLWGGIISEVGIENIKLNSNGYGRVYREFQQFLLELYNHGVILAICSKNNIKDIEEVFDKHSDMVLKKEHIACFKVNWKNKSINILEISKVLNISLDSIVFIDDMWFEVEEVRQVLPEVNSFLFDINDIYELMSCLNLRNRVDMHKVHQRIETYKTDSKRNELKQKYELFEDYLDALRIEIEIKRAEKIEIARISELTLRTNKFTNGVRYTPNEIKEKLFSKEYDLYTVKVKDKYSDLGVVGTMGIYGNTLDLFSLSCRALGRGVEQEMFSYLKEYQIKKITWNDTGKNKDSKQFFISNWQNSCFDSG